MPVRFSEVIPGEIFRGGDPSPEDLRTLKYIWGLKRVVSLDLDCGFRINNICDQLNIEHIILPILHFRSSDQVKQLKDQISDLLSVRPVYLHCIHGRDRTGLAIALFRIANGWSAANALVEAKRFGFPEGLTPPEANLFIKTIMDEDNGQPKQDVVSTERAGLDNPSVQNSARHSFDPVVPIEDHPEGQDSQYADDSSHKRKKRQQAFRTILLDQNSAMADVGGYENNNPVLRGLGPIEPFGIYPFGYSMIY